MKTFIEFLEEETRKKKTHFNEGILKHTGKKIENEEFWTPYGGSAHYDEIHEHPDIKPNNLTDDHKEAIKNYVEYSGHGSSADINKHLRNLADKKTSKAHSETLSAIKHLSSAFSKENTNKQDITLHAGIPKRIGRQIENSKPGTKHTFAGFVSTSTDKKMAKAFADERARKEGEEHDQYHHMIQFHAEPGSALSIAPLSGHSENEMIVHHGAHATYVKTTTQGKYKIHHMKLHSSHTNLEDYGKNT